MKRSSTYENKYPRTPLPCWVMSLLPPPRPVFLMRWSEEQQRVVVEDEQGQELGSYDTVENAYSAQDSRDHHLCFDESLSGQGAEVDSNLLITKQGVLLFGGSDEETLALQEHLYHRFLKLNDQYQQRPQDFALCYRWLDQHPVFWWQRPRNPYSVLQDEHMQNLIIRVHENERGETRVTVSHQVNAQAQVREAATLVAEAPTFEEAVVSLAAQAHEAYTHEGKQRH